MKQFFYFILFLLFINNIWGQVSISSFPYSQNFDGIGTTATASLPSGFKFGNNTIDFTTGANTTATTQAAGTSGTGALNGTSSGGAYNFANGVTATSTDRAIGFLTSGSYTSPRDIFFAFTNTTGSTITNLTISFDYEKYRSGTRAWDWTFFHGSTSTSVNTSATGGDQSYASDAANAVVNPPTTTATKTITISGISIANGSSYYFRWRSTGSGGNTNAQGLAIDNINICIPPTSSVLTSSVSSLCNGSSANLSVAITGGTSPYTVVYSNGSNQTVNSYTSGSNISISPISNTTYSLVSVTDANSCTSTGLSGTPTITVNPRPSASVLSSTSSVVCNGASSSNLQVNITGGTSPFTVVYNDGANQTVNGYTSASNISVSPTATTSYSLVSVTDANGCTSTGLSGTPTITLVSASTNATLAASSTTSNTVEQCTDGAGWTYYATSGAPTQLLFGIKKGSNTFNASVDITAGATISKTSSNGVNQENGMFLMGRYWDVTLNSGTITTPVDIRFFYDPNELTAAKTARDAAFAALPGTTLAVTNGNTAEWFKSINSAFNASYISSILGNKFPGTIQKFTSPSTGTLNGVDYVELTGITSFSGGTGGFSFGANGGSGNSLPVTWASFDVKSTEMGNKLTWETASEKNTSHFEVEYSYDGINFNSTATHIPAAGNSNNLNTYSYTHSDFSSYIYYRVKQIDNDTRYDYSVTKMIKRTNDNTFNVSLYPLPVSENNEVNLNITSIDKSEVKLSIMNMTGQVVFSKSIVPTLDFISEKINIANLISGVYQLEVMNSQGKRMIKFSK